MAIALNIIHLGESPFTTTQIQGDVSTSVLPAGTTQATAAQMSAAINDIATTPTNTGVLLPGSASTPGDSIFVYNGGANTLKVYGASTESINSGGAGAAFSVATTKSAEFLRMTATAWRALLSS